MTITEDQRRTLDLMATRIQAGEVRLQLPQPENVRPIKAVS